VRDRGGEPARVGDVVGIDDAHDVHVGLEMGEAPVQRAALEAGPLRQVDELDAVTLRPQALARRFFGPPQVLVGRVVVDDLHAHRRIGLGDERAHGLDDELGWLVVGGDLEAHDRRVPAGGRGDGDRERGAQRVEHLEGARGDERHRANLEHQQHEAQQERQRLTPEQEGRAHEIGGVERERDEHGGHEPRADGPPAARHREGERGDRDEGGGRGGLEHRRERQDGEPGQPEGVRRRTGPGEEEEAGERGRGEGRGQEGGGQHGRFTGVQLGPGARNSTREAASR
jgi:hypothetical protein